MERNSGTTPNAGRQRGSSSGSSGSSGASSSSTSGSTSGSTSADASSGVEALADRAKSVAGDVEQKASEVVDQARATTGNFQATLADKLESGAQALRERSQQMTQSGGSSRLGAVGGDDTSRSSGTGGFGQRARATVADAEQALAGRMDSTATWLRQNDITDIGAAMEHQVKRHPGRTALIALAVGFLFGRATSSRK